MQLRDDSKDIAIGSGDTEHTLFSSNNTEDQFVEDKPKFVKFDDAANIKKLLMKVISKHHGGFELLTAIETLIKLIHSTGCLIADCSKTEVNELGHITIPIVDEFCEGNINAAVRTSKHSATLASMDIQREHINTLRKYGKLIMNPILVNIHVKGKKWQALYQSYIYDTNAPISALIETRVSGESAVTQVFHGVGEAIFESGEEEPFYTPFVLSSADGKAFEPSERSEYDGPDALVKSFQNHSLLIAPVVQYIASEDESFFDKEIPNPDLENNLNFSKR